MIITDHLHNQQLVIGRGINMPHKFTFEHGCMWEGGEWIIDIDHECSSFGGGMPCKHCHSKQTKHKPNAYGGTYSQEVWICPTVIIAANEGGYNTTGVCLQCVLDAAKLVERQLEVNYAKKKTS